MAYISLPDRIRLLLQAGFPATSIGTLLAISQAESNGQSGAISPTNDYGWLQVNASHVGEPGCPSTAQGLLDPTANAACALHVYDTQGLTAWTTYTSGAAGAFSGVANAAVAAYNAVYHTVLGTFSGPSSSSSAPAGAANPALFGITGSTPFLGGIGSGLGGIGNWFGGHNPLSIPGDIGSAIAGGIQAATGSIEDFLGTVIYRGFFILIGIVMVVLAVVLLVTNEREDALKSMFSGQGTPQPEPLPVETVAAE